MKVPLPNLDDRRWADLVDEGRSLIPLYAPEWTDHNLHDPGITLMELFAWIAEMDIYQLNRVPDKHKRKFLALVGTVPEPPRPARTVLSFTVAAGGAPLPLPAEVEFAGYDPFGADTTFRTLESLTIVPGRIASVVVKDAHRLRDMTDHWRRGEGFPLFGAIPQPGAELYLGFDQAWPPGEPVNLFFNLEGKRVGEEERCRLIREVQERRLACRPLFSDFPCQDETPSAPTAGLELERIPPHHGVRLVWGVLTSEGTETVWRRLGASEVDDDTRAFTLDGRVRIKLSVGMAKLKASQGPIVQELYYLRVRFEAGAYDAPPMLRHVTLNGVAAEQATPVGAEHIIQGESVTAAKLGIGNGRPNQQLTLPVAPVQVSSFRLFTFEPARNGWRAWQVQPDFDASTRADTHVLLDPSGGSVTFGDGEKGQVAPAGAEIYASYRATRAEAGNLAAYTIDRLVDSPHSRAVVDKFDDVNKRFPVSFRVTDKALASLRAEGVSETVLKKLEGIKEQQIQGEADFLRVLKTFIGEEQIALYKTVIFKHTRVRCEVSQPDCVTVTNPVPATGGAPAETLAGAIARAIEVLSATRRAVTLRDYEELAMKTPGVQLARARALPNLHPSFPCLKAPGMITLIILPGMPGVRPSPGSGLRRAVAAYLQRRRVIGTRVEVVGPTYLEVAVRARVSALPGVNKANLQQKIVAALNEFFDPLRGGPERGGWPFGRDVFRSEVMQVIDEVAGVDCVISLALIAEGYEPECGNVCLSPTWLVAAGQHEIEVV